MPKMTKAQARKRLQEAKNKLSAVMTCDFMSLADYAKANKPIMDALRKLR